MLSIACGAIFGVVGLVLLPIVLSVAIYIAWRTLAVSAVIGLIWVAGVLRLIRNAVRGRDAPPQPSSCLGDSTLADRHG